jgi:hypothetical protein
LREAEEKKLILKCEAPSRKKALQETLDITLPEVPGITNHN